MQNNAELGFTLLYAALHAFFCDTLQIILHCFARCALSEPLLYAAAVTYSSSSRVFVILTLYKKHRISVFV